MSLATSENPDHQHLHCLLWQKNDHQRKKFNNNWKLQPATLSIFRRKNPWLSVLMNCSEDALKFTIKRKLSRMSVKYSLNPLVFRTRKCYRKHVLWVFLQILYSKSPLTKNTWHFSAIKSIRRGFYLLVQLAPSLTTTIFPMFRCTHFYFNCSRLEIIRWSLYGW